jgi:hypothetical protein
LAYKSRGQIAWLSQEQCVLGLSHHAGGRANHLAGQGLSFSRDIQAKNKTNDNAIYRRMVIFKREIYEEKHYLAKKYANFKAKLSWFSFHYAQ